MSIKARQFYITNDINRELIFEQLTNWDEIDDDQVTKVKDFLWNIWKDRLTKHGLKRDNFKICTKKITGYNSTIDNKNIVLKVAILKPDQKLITIDLYPGLMASGFDSYEPHNGW
jgi:hypothetical protein